VLYHSHLSHASSPFCFRFFQIRSYIFLPRDRLGLWSSSLASPRCWDHRPETSIPSLFAEMVSLTFYLGWPQTILLLISAPQVPGITGVSLVPHAVFCLKLFWTLQQKREFRMFCFTGAAMGCQSAHRLPQTICSQRPPPIMKDRKYSSCWALTIINICVRKGIWLESLV
jgi:hypothetical protein